MKVQDKKLENATVELAIEVEADTISNEYESVFLKIQSTAKLDGFRKGKAPISIIKTKFAPQAEQQVVENIIRDNYIDAIKEKNLSPITQPKFDFDRIKPSENFEFKAVFEVAPTIELKDYLGLAVDEKQCKVTDKDVDFEIENIRESKADISKKEEGSVVEKGDLVKFKVKRIDNVKKEEIESTPEQDRSVIAGKDNEEYNFNKEVIDLKVGDEKEVKMKYPKDYEIKDLAGQKIVYQIKISEINARKLPNLDDEFAKDLGEYTSLEDLKNKTKENLEKYVTERCRGEAKSKILQQAIENSSFDIPNSIVDQEKVAIYQRLQQRIGIPTSNMEQFAQMMGMQPDEFINKLGDEALQSIKSTMVLAEIVNKEELKVTDEKYQEAVKDMAKRNNKTEEEMNALIDQQNARKNIESELLFDQAMDLIYEKAKVKKLSPVPFKEFIKEAR